MARLFALLPLFIVQAFAVTAQHRPFDSLSHVLQASARDERRVDILNALSNAYYDNDAREGLRYATESLELATDLGYKRGERLALILKGFFYHSVGEFRQALIYYWRSADLELPEDELLGYNLVMTANTYRELASYDSAEYYYNRSIRLLSGVGAPLQLAFAYKNVARLFLLQWKNEDAEKVLNEALEIYQAGNYKYGQSDTWFWLAKTKKQMAEYDAANKYAATGCLLANEVDDEFLILRCLISEGGILSQLGEYTQALTKYFEALGILQSKDMALRLASAYTDIGEIYRAMGQYNISRKYYAQALQVAEPIGVKYEIAKIYIGIAATAARQGQFSGAHEYVEKSLVIRKQIGDEPGIANCYNIEGTTYYLEKRYDEAIRYLDQALAIRRRINQREGVSGTLYNLSAVFAARNEFAKALQFQKEGLAVEESVGNVFSIAYSHNRLGNLYTQLGKYPQAEAHLRKAQAVAIEAKSNAMLMNNNLNWASYYQARGNPSRALEYYKKYNENKDSIYNDIGAQKLAELQALYTVEKKDQEIRLLHQQRMISQNEIEIQRAQINRQYIVIVSVVISLVLVSLLLYSTFRYSTWLKRANQEISDQKEKIQSQSAELMDANQTIAEINKRLETKIEDRTQALSQAYKELDTFFYRSSHDFRRPLTTFMGLAEVAKVTVKDTNALELFEKVKDTASNLDKMLVKLQSISDMGTQQLVYKEVRVKAIYDTVCDSFRDEIHRRDIKVSAEVDLKSPFMSYPAMVKIIIENLVENAIHFSAAERPFIKLRASQAAGYVTMDLQDNGQGIGWEYQDQVFDMYFRGNEHSKGNGLGLYIVKKAVEKLNGSISFSSIPQVGTTFTVMLPMSLRNG